MKRIAIWAALLTLLMIAGCSPAEVPENPAVLRATPDAQTPAVLETPAFEISLGDLPNPYPPEEAVSNGDYVNLHGQISNESKMTEFLEAVAEGRPAAIRTVNYTVEGDAIIGDIVFDGDKFSVSCDTTRDAFGARQVTQSAYANLLEYERDGTRYVFLTDEGEITDELYESGFDGYLLLFKQEAVETCGVGASPNN